MLGVTRLPPWVEEALAAFEPLFSDNRNVTSFVAFVSAVILTEAKWTVSELARGISRPDAKSGSAYRYFLGEADWSATELAQYLADYAFDQLDVGAGDEVFLHVDDKVLTLPAVSYSSFIPVRDIPWLRHYNSSSVTDTTTA